MQAYPKYKDSGVPWLGDVPEHWEVLRLGSQFAERKQKVSDKDFAPLSVTKKGILPQLDTAAKSNDGDNRKKVCSGDFVINSRSDRKGSSGVSPHTGSVSLINTVLTPISLDGRYVHNFFRSHSFQEEFYRVGRGIVADLWSTKYADMRTIMIPVPTEDEQQQISRYLDWQTSKINKFIKAKKKLIALLKEQKQNVINEAVTKGINPDVEMKDSGVEWLGEIPKHWDVRRCKYILREINVRSVDGSEEHLSMSQKHGGLVGREEITERRLMSENYAGGKICNKGDIVLNRLKAHLGVFAVAPRIGVISPDYTVLNVMKIAFPEFIECVLKSSKLRPELRVRCKGIVEGFWRLYTDDLYTLSLPLPPKEEQNEIMMAIARRSSKVDQTISKAEREIELIQEYRTRLVSNVVTGKVDVRSVEITDFEPVEADPEAQDDEASEDELITEGIEE